MGDNGAVDNSTNNAGLNFSGFAYAATSQAKPLNGSDSFNRLRLDAFVTASRNDWEVTSYTFVTEDAAHAPRSGYGETRIWVGHSALPLSFNLEDAFGSAANDLGRVGAVFWLNRVPFVRETLDTMGTWAYVELNPLEFDLGKGGLANTMSSEIFYSLDPFQNGVRPKIVGFADLIYDKNLKSTSVNTEHRIELAIPAGKAEFAPAIEWRRYGFLPGNEMDRQSVAGIVALKCPL